MKITNSKIEKLKEQLKLEEKIFYVLMKEKKMTTLPISQSDLDEINKDLADDGVIYDLDTSGIDIEAVDPEINSDD